MRFIWCVTIFSGCILLCSQFIHLYHLYKLERNSYIHYQNEFIKGGVHEFNMKSANLKNQVAWLALTRKAIIWHTGSTIENQLPVTC